MAKKDLTAICILIDGSSSMESIRKGVISGFNEFLVTQKAVEGKAVLSMFQFSTGYDATPTYILSRHSHKDYNHMNYKTIYNFMDLQEVKPLSTRTYVPNGGTPLIDAAVKTIDDFGQQLSVIPEKDRPSKVVFVVITDGEENSSKNHTREELLSKITHQTSKYDWQFVYLGANQDSFAEAGSYGISLKSAANFVATDAGMTRAYAATSSSLGSYRTGVSNTVDMTDFQKEDTNNKVNVPITAGK